MKVPAVLVHIGHLYFMWAGSWQAAGCLFKVLFLQEASPLRNPASVLLLMLALARGSLKASWDIPTESGQTVTAWQGTPLEPGRPHGRGTEPDPQQRVETT